MHKETKADVASSPSVILIVTNKATKSTTKGNTNASKTAFIPIEVVPHTITCCPTYHYLLPYRTTIRTVLIMYIDYFFLGLRNITVTFHAARRTSRTLKNLDPHMRAVYAFHNTKVFYIIIHFANHTLQIRDKCTTIFQYPLSLTRFFL